MKHKTKQDKVGWPGTVMPVNPWSCTVFIRRGGRVPAPLQGLGHQPP